MFDGHAEPGADSVPARVARETDGLCCALTSGGVAQYGRESLVLSHSSETDTWPGQWSHLISQPHTTSHTSTCLGFSHENNQPVGRHFYDKVRVQINLYGLTVTIS